MKILIVICCYITFTTAARITIPGKNRNEDFFKDDVFTFSQDEKDTKDPTVFTGNVMQAATLQTENSRKKGKFKYVLETQNGIEIEQVGKLKDDKKTLVVMGSYAYTGADGRRYRVRYTADEFGYHPITTLDIEIPELGTNEAPPQTAKPFVYSTRAPTEAPTEAPDRSYLPPVAYLPPKGYLPPSKNFA